MPQSPVTLDMSTAQPIQAVKLDMSTVRPIQSRQEPFDQDAEDRKVTEAWAQNHPILGPIARFLVTGGQNAENAISKTPGMLYHAITDPPTTEEAGLPYEQRLALRLGEGQAIRAGMDYAAGKVTPKGAISVLPEALGTGLGQVSGGAVYGKAGEIGGEIPAAARAAANSETAAKLVQSGKVLGASAEELPVIGSTIKAVKKAGDLRDIWMRDKFPGNAGAPYPAAPSSDLVQAASLLRGPQQVVDPAAGLGQIPVKTAPPATVAKPPASIKPAQVQAAAEDALGVKKLQPNVPLKQQGEGAPAPKAETKGPAIPEGHTPVESSALRSYKYDPAAREFTAATRAGNVQYVYGDVSADDVASFEKAASKGQAWQQIRGNPLVAKIVDGKRIPVKPASSGDLTQALQDSLDAARAKKK